MQYHLAPLFCRPWTLNGITPRLIESHYENNYGSALQPPECHHRGTRIARSRRRRRPDVVSRLKRDEAAALNSTLLHELYFASLGGDGRAVPETDGDSARPRLRLGRPLAPGVHRAGQCAGRRLGLGRC